MGGAIPLLPLCVFMAWAGRTVLFSFHYSLFTYWKFKNGPPEEYPLMGFYTSCNKIQLYNEELHLLSSPPNIRVVKSRRMR
jgi:hypothetical protein